MQDFSPPLILLIVKQHCFELLWDCRSIIIITADCEANLVMEVWCVVCAVKGGEITPFKI